MEIEDDAGYILAPLCTVLHLRSMGYAVAAIAVSSLENEFGKITEGFKYTTIVDNNR